ncbi:hypothetical protein ACB377_07590 [Klebsiella michiganensis]
MSLNKIWRAVAYSTDRYKPHDEVHVFVDAPDSETAKKRLYERLSDEWELASGFIDFHNLYCGSELFDVAAGPLAPRGLPLLESGGGNGKVNYDSEPLILVASASLRGLLEIALREIPA